MRYGSGLIHIANGKLANKKGGTPSGLGDFFCMRSMPAHGVRAPLVQYVKKVQVRGDYVRCMARSACQ